MKPLTFQLIYRKKHTKSTDALDKCHSPKKKRKDSFLLILGCIKILFEGVG